MDYRVARIPKRNGKFREVYIVSKVDRETLSSYLPSLEAIYEKYGGKSSNFAFVKGKNCALHALQHVGCRFVLSLDLEDFFDSVTEDHVKGLVPDDLIDKCFINGAPRQGLPTSPIISTIAFLNCDAQIRAALKNLGLDCVYTRYADDLVFGFNHKRDKGKIMHVARQVIKAHGFTINEAKTRFQSLSNGRLIITGVGVDEHGIHVTRSVRKRLRAALHQGNFDSAMGLIEWSKCKLPRSFFLPE